MSTSLPDQVARPDFAIVVRGYDRAQVDAYFGRALEWVADADGRAAAAERDRDKLAREVSELRATVAVLEGRAGLPVPQSMSEFSDRIGRLMQNALEAANELQSQAEREALERKEAIAAEAERLTEQAGAEAERIVQKARENERAMEESIADLRAARQDALAQLAELHRQLAAVLDMPDPDESRHEEPTGHPEADRVDGAADEGVEEDATSAAVAGHDGAEVAAHDAGSEGPGGGSDKGAAGEGKGGAFVTPVPTVVQEAGARSAGDPSHVAPADAPTIVQPAVAPRSGPGTRPTRPRSSRR